MDVIRTRRAHQVLWPCARGEDTSMSAPPGPVYGFLDPNGTGKTAMIRCLLDTLGPSAGGAEVTRASSASARSSAN